MYECPICLSLNHASRLHCSICGTIPAMYSMIGVASSQVHRSGEYETGDYQIPIVVAIGSSRSCQHRAQRVNLRTVTADYYASE
jgi:hypothetical protein